MEIFKVLPCVYGSEGHASIPSSDVKGGKCDANIETVHHV